MIAFFAVTGCGSTSPSSSTPADRSTAAGASSGSTRSPGYSSPSSSSTRKGVLKGQMVKSCPTPAELAPIMHETLVAERTHGDAPFRSCGYKYGGYGNGKTAPGGELKVLYTSAAVEEEWERKLFAAAGKPYDAAAAHNAGKLVERAQRNIDKGCGPDGTVCLRGANEKSADLAVLVDDRSYFTASSIFVNETKSAVILAYAMPDGRYCQTAAGVTVARPQESSPFDDIGHRLVNLSKYVCGESP